MQPKGQVDGEQANIPVLLQRSRAGTEKGRSAGQWMSRCNPVGSPVGNKTAGQRREETPSGLVSRVTDPMLPRKAAGCVDAVETVPETDSGGRVENTKAFERSQVKELGKLTP